jgi:hypothetical protein
LVILPRLGFFCQGHLYWFLVRLYQKLSAPFSWTLGFGKTLRLFPAWPGAPRDETSLAWSG